MTIQRICTEHGHQPADAMSWLRNVQYSLGNSTNTVSKQRHFGIDTNKVCESVVILKQAHVVPNDFEPSLVWGEYDK